VVRSSGLAIAGLDSESGLATVKGNLALYHKLLRQFAVSHRADMQLILQQLRAGNTQQAQYLAHTLKGVAATLGANPVAALATTLDLALQQNSALEHTMEIARQGDVALAQLADAIITAIGAVTTKVSAVRKNPLADTKHSQQIVCELERLLSESNSRANALTQASADLLLDKMGDKYFDFYRQIDVFDYESALKILREFS
jgi:HPt (histidine-containing phosphotransfer) domain-containing protein